MKTKETLEPKNTSPEKTLPEQKPKSFRPMRSLVAVRSFKPKTAVAAVNLNKAVENVERA